MTIKRQKYATLKFKVFLFFHFNDSMFCLVCSIRYGVPMPGVPDDPEDAPADMTAEERAAACCSLTASLQVTLDEADRIEKNNLGQSRC